MIAALEAGDVAAVLDLLAGARERLEAAVERGELRDREIAVLQLVREAVDMVESIISKTHCGVEKIGKDFCSGWFVGAVNGNFYVVRIATSGVSSIGFVDSRIRFHKDRVELSVSSSGIRLCYNGYCEEIDLSSVDSVVRSVRSIGEQIRYLARHVNRHLSKLYRGINQCRQLNAAGC